MIAIVAVNESFGIGYKGEFLVRITYLVSRKPATVRCADQLARI